MLLNKCRNVCKNNGQVLQESSRQLNWVCTSFGVLLPVFVLATACAHPWSKPIGTAKPFQASAETTCQHTVPTQWHSKHHVCSWRPAWCSEFLFNPICQIHTLVYRGPRLQISIWFNCNLYHISYIYIICGWCVPPAGIETLCIQWNAGHMLIIVWQHVEGNFLVGAPGKTVRCKPKKLRSDVTVNWSVFDWHGEVSTSLIEYPIMSK